jgi:membrane fusion protein (multidrug efflux system)
MLKLNRALGDQWLVDSGLAPGDRLIVDGLMKVRPGAQVKAVPWESAQAGAPAAPNTQSPPAESK